MSPTPPPSDLLSPSLVRFAEARTTAERQRAPEGGAPKHWWFAFDRWLLVAEPDDEFVLG